MDDDNSFVSETSDIASDGGESIRYPFGSGLKPGPAPLGRRAGPGRLLGCMIWPHRWPFRFYWGERKQKPGSPHWVSRFILMLKYTKDVLFIIESLLLWSQTLQTHAASQKTHHPSIPCLLSPDLSPKWWHLQTARHRTERAARAY